jgi:hypothetical protein
VLSDGRVVSGSDDLTLRVWLTSSGVCERIVQRTDADFASLDPSGREGHSPCAEDIGLRHYGPVLATSASHIHVGESLSASNAASCVSGITLVCGAYSGKVYVMAGFAAC